MLSLTSPIQTPFHRIRASVKLAALVASAGAVMWIDAAPPLLLLLCAVVLMFAAGGRIFALHGLRTMRPVVPLAVILGLWHLWLDAPEAGAVMILRMLIAMGLANLVTMTTRLDQMIAVIERITPPILPPQVLSLSIALMIRFIPVMAIRVGQIRDAWRARSPRRPAWRIVAPAALAAFDDAEQVAEALRARGGLS